MPNKTLLIGSANPEKTTELTIILKNLPWTIQTLHEFPPIPQPIENGATFAENALIKARYYCEHFTVCCIADDSGLEVTALGGAPGIHSARYAGPTASYADNNAKLLRQLATTHAPHRSARFVCCAAFAAPGEKPHIEFGAIDGQIATECRGKNGFGYDPLFIPKGFNLTFAELDPATKHAISHRARAFRALRHYLETHP